jgi:cell wall-associated NlpC family hydrolase
MSSAQCAASVAPDSSTAQHAVPEPTRTSKSPRGRLAFVLPSGVSRSALSASTKKQVPVSPRTACAIPLSFFCLATSASADPVALAASLIGRPYVWGAEGPREFDCSGLTQYVYREYGIDLPRRAISQSQAGDRAGRRLQRGDLVFFSTGAGGSVVTHVGLYEGNGMMIDASKRHGTVRRDSLDDDYWVERFMFARRIAGADDALELPDPRPQSPSPRTDRRNATTRVLERVAGILLRRPRQ